MKPIDLKCYDTFQASITEEACREFLAQLKWPSGKPTCPICDSSEKIYTYTPNKRFRCISCKKDFSLTAGTIFHCTKIPLRKWFLAIYLFSSSKKGMSSYQIGRWLNISQPNAWNMLHRIRYAMTNSSIFKGKLEGVVEADESYVGGLNKNRHYNKRIKGSQGRSTIDKSAVFGLLQRDGCIYTWVLKKLHKKGMQALIKSQVKHGSTLSTDEYNGYRGLSRFYNHGVVNHGGYQYVDGDNHTNTLEGFWAWLKKGLKSTYHSVSKFFLPRYCREFAYRFNTRKQSDGERFTELLSSFFGGRFTRKGLYLR